MSGRILDSLHSWTRGALSGAGIMLWISLGLGVSLEMLGMAIHGIFELMVRYLIAAGAVGGLAFVVIDSLRTRHYMDILARAGRDSSQPAVPKFQAARALKPSAFFGWKIVGGILIGIGALMSIGALTTMDDASSFLIFLAVGATGLGGGIALFKVASKLDAWAKKQVKYIRVTPENFPPSGSKKLMLETRAAKLGSWKHRLEVLATIPTAASILALIGWGGATGRLAVIGDRVTVLPDNFHRDVTEAQMAWGHGISLTVVIAAVWVVVLSLPIVLLGIAQYERVNRWLREIENSSSEPASYLRREISVIALYSDSKARRATFYAAAAGVSLIAFGVAGTIEGWPATLITFVLGALLLIGPIYLDVRAEPADRARRNHILKTWPSADVGKTSSNMIETRY